MHAMTAARDTGPAGADVELVLVEDDDALRGALMVARLPVTSPVGLGPDSPSDALQTRRGRR